MIRISATITLLLALCSAAPATDFPKLDQFKAQLTEAVNAKNLKALNDLFHTEGASRYQIDQAIHTFEQSWEKGVIDGIELRPLDDPAFKSDGPRAMVEGGWMNGRHYRPNLQPVLFCTVYFKNTDGSGRARSLRVLAIDPRGDFKFPLLDEGKAEPN
jgi:hypothetical protein